MPLKCKVMNKKKSFAVLMMIVSVIMFSLTLFSCGGSDDSDSTPPATAPKVVSTSPGNNATDVSIGTINVQITYDQAVSIDNSKTITVSGATLKSNASVNGKVVTIPVECNGYETKVTITIPEGFVSVAGAKADAYTLSFTTAKKPEEVVDTFESATAAVKNMGLGWNLGNTLDAHDASKSSWTTTAAHETCWGQPVTKRELFKMMKEAGFGAIRVPVTWYQEMDSEGKVKDAWMKRVKEVVDYVIGEGLYCIINVHHDTGADNGAFKSWIKADGTNYTQNKTKFEYLWKQIAETFKDYDQQLLFEGYNEMLDSKNTWNEPVNKTDGYKAINDYAKSFVSVVRATGGKNAHRNLIVNTYSGSNSADAMKALELPEESKHIAFQIHNYPDWQSESHARELVDYLISTIKTNLISKGAPVIIGEYSTLCTYPERDWYDVNRKVALYAMDYFIKKTKEAGIGTFFWMGLSDGASRSVPSFNQPDLAETLAKAYHGESYAGKFPTASFEYVVTYTAEWQELFLYGDWNDKNYKLSDYKGISVEMDKAYGDKLQIKIYGNKISEDKYNEQYVPLSESSATTTATFDAATLGSSFQRITLQTNAGAQTARLKSAKLIKADGTEVEGTITVAWGCEVAGEAVVH